MRCFALSTHAATLAEQAQQARELLDADAAIHHSMACTSRHQRMLELKADALRAIGNLNLISAVVPMGKLAWLMWSSKPPKPQLTPASRQELVWQSGQHGETLARQHFEGILDDDWTGVSGYMNEKGEIDLVLVGPHGIICLEIKYFNALVHCVEDVWTRDKFDRYGNLVQSGLPIKDKTGRSPARQLLEPCAAFAQFLQKWGLPFEVPIRTAVLLTHANSRVGRVRSTTVDFIGRIDEFTVESLMEISGNRPPSVNVPVVVELLHMHHHQCAEQRAGHRATSTGGHE